MPVPFKELGGSPVEEYGRDGFRATRQFLIAWEDRDAFAAEVLGAAVSQGDTAGAHYPDKTAVFAVRLRYEPFDPDVPDAKTLPSLTEGLNSYTNSFAKAIAEYETISGPDRPDGPANESGTQLTYRMCFAVDEQLLSARGWKWEDDPSLLLPDDLGLVKRLPATEHHLTWHQVINPPWDVIQSLQGTVNADVFLGCPTETLLLEGAEANKLYRGSLEDGASAFCWRIHYVFRERAIKHAGGVYGWNHVYREAPPGWVRVTSGGARLYDSADFSPLFQSGASP